MCGHAPCWAEASNELCYFTLYARISFLCVRRTTLKMFSGHKLIRRSPCRAIAISLTRPHVPIAFGADAANDRC